MRKITDRKQRPDHKQIMWGVYVLITLLGLSSVVFTAENITTKLYASLTIYL